MTLLVLHARLLFRRLLGIRDMRTSRLRYEIAHAKARRSEELLNGPADGS